MVVTSLSTCGTPAHGTVSEMVRWDRDVVRLADVHRLPGPNTDIWDWQLHSACRALDSAVFFHPDRERGPAKDERERHAKAVCAGCPVIAECRRHALQVQEPYGAWGGLTVAERAAMLATPARRPEPAAAPMLVEVRGSSCCAASSTRT